MSRVAVIDIGTNSVRLDIRDRTASGWNIVLQEKEIIHLGKSVFTTGEIDAGSTDALIRSLSRFETQCREHEVSRIVALGTSALREASNSEEIVETVRRSLGIAIEIISGLREANLIAKGILAERNRPGENLILCDIGGGSTELSFCRGHSVSRAVSLPLGALRLQQVQLKSIPPLPDSVAELRAHVMDRVDAELADETKFSGAFVCSGGSAKALTRLFSRQDRVLPSIERNELSTLIEQMVTKTCTELMTLSGMEEKRVEVILAGALLLEQLLKIFHAERFWVTDRTLRDGAFAEMATQTNAV